MVEGIDEAVAAVCALDRLDCRRIRPRFERRFAAERMARDDLALYSALPAPLRAA